VALILLPQSLAYANVAGMPAERGVLAALLPPAVAGLFGSSRYLQTGPTAIAALLTFGALSAVATPGSDDYIALAAALALLVGLVRVVVGLMHFGAVAFLMSQPVLVGFSAAAALLIVASQVPAVLGSEVRHASPIVAGITAALDLGRGMSWLYFWEPGRSA